MAENPREGSLEARLRLRRVTPTHGLQLLGFLEQHLAARPRPALLRLECLGGQTLQGELVRFHAQEQSVLLSQQGSLTWVDLTHVQAISLGEADDWLHELTEGLLPAARGPAPTRLQLRRLAEQLVQKLTPAQLQMPWEHLPDDDQSALHLQQLLKDIGICWEQIGADELGAHSLHSVRLVQLEIGTTASAASLEGGLCRIRLTRGPDGLLAYPFERLLQELEKQL